MNGEVPIKVLYIAGSGRCGSTLVARLLGELDGYCNVGEASRYLFNLEMQGRRLPCSCGRDPKDCTFWAHLLSDIPPDIAKFVTARVRIRNIPWMTRRLSNPRKGGFLDQASTSLKSVFESIAAREQGAVIVDSSKNPATGLLLSSLDRIELSVVHLVRDPRAVVASWRKPKEYLGAHPLPRVVGWWIAYNLGAEYLGTRAHRYLRFRYEDVVECPKDMITAVTSAVTGRTPETAFLTAEGATFEDTQHALAGNPEKFAKGVLTIRRRPWILPGYRRAAVTAMCFPLMARYGYLH